MNKKDILTKLKGYVLYENIKSVQIDNVEWKAEISNKNTALFYNLSDSLLAQDAFYNRIKSSCYGVLITDFFDEKIKKISNVIIIKPDSWLVAQKILCDIFYPIKGKLKLIGITGTNGKTTTADLIRQLVEQVMHKAFVVGTLGITNNTGVIFETGLTTPPYIWNRQFIHKYQDDYDVAIFEVSSHALVQKRIFKLDFDYVIWTSFSQDHLDYHKTMSEYFEAKRLILNYSKHPVIVSGKAHNIFSKLKPQEYEIARSFEEITLKQIIPLFFESKFNQNNFECAYHCVKLLYPSSKISLSSLKPPPGRFNVIEWKKRKIIIDFAHTPDALLNIGGAIKSIYVDSKIITVFGCGGDRDRSKRVLMGRAVSQFSSFVYLTNDNPRNENPEQIVSDIIPGLEVEYQVILSRKEAIKNALDKSQEGNIILIAGKGHESYILVKDEKIQHLDEAVVREYIKKHHD